MKTTVTKHKRGFFGRVWQVSFWLFQAFMVWLIFINVGNGAELAGECAGDAACEAGTAIGAGIIAIAGWFIWFIGTIVLAIFMFATRGTLVTYEKD
jgi:uncharacterized membrane protein YhaH (DUF805 family)